MLERGLVGAFRFFLIVRLLLWILMYRASHNDTISLEVSSFRFPILLVIFILDLLVLILLSWPSLNTKIDAGHFRWILVLTTTVLLIGHAHILSIRDFQRSSNIAAYFTPYSIFLFTSVLFVAWQYDLRAVLLYGGVVISILPFLQWQFGILTIVTLLVATLTILLPGWLIARMMAQQRQQQAALAAAAEEQARTNEQLVHYAASLEELTISRERNRLARELHDTLAHSLSAVAVQLGGVETLWESRPDVARALLAQADESTRHGLEEARLALQALRASPLADLGLLLALEALAKEAAARSGTTLHLTLPEDNLNVLEPHIEQGIYRIAQETLENCARHAEAKTLWVTLTHSIRENQTGQDQTEQIQLIIRDDGQGFDPSQTIPTGHYGVAGMKERASVIGGTLQVESSLGEGTTVQLVVPLRGARVNSQFVNYVS